MCASEPERDVTVYLGRKFDQDSSDWSQLRRTGDSKAERDRATGSFTGSATVSSFTSAAVAAAAGTIPDFVLNARNALQPFSSYFQGRGTNTFKKLMETSAAAPLPLVAQSQPQKLARSQPQKWATSKAPITMPLQAGHAQDTDSTVSLSVLIVEDSMATLKAMTMNLRRVNHTVEQAVNGLIGLERMTQKQYDVVMMDVEVGLGTPSRGDQQRPSI